MRRSASSPSAISAGAIGTLLSLANVVVGFSFQAMLAARLGVNTLADVFQFGWTIVTFVAVVQFTLVTSLFIPRLQIVVDGVQRIGNSRLPTVLGVLCCVIQLLSALLLAKGDLRVLLLLSAPAQIFIGGTTVPQATAYVSRRFWIAGVGPVVNGIALLFVSLSRLSHLNAAILGVAISAGYFSQWLITWLGVRDLAQSAYPGQTIHARLFLGVLAFTLVSKFQPVLERVMSYQIATGATAALGYGQKIAQGLLLFGTFSIATASAASLARHVNGKNVHEAATLLARTTVSTLVFSTLVTALAMPASYPVVVALFQRGEFNANDSQYVANIVILQLPWVLAGALAGVLTSYLYIERRYAQVLIASLVGLCATAAVGFFLRDVAPRYAVASASSVGMMASLVVIIAILRRTAVWQPYCKMLLIRWKIAASAGVVVVVSGLCMVTLQLLTVVPTFLDYTVATTVVAVSGAAILLFHESNRRRLWEALSAEL